MDSLFLNLSSPLWEPLRQVVHTLNSTSTLWNEASTLFFNKTWYLSTKQWMLVWVHELFFGRGKLMLEMTHDKLGLFVVGLATLLVLYFILLATRFLQRVLFLFVNTILKLLVIALSFLLLLSFFQEYLQQQQHPKPAI